MTRRTLFHLVLSAIAFGLARPWWARVESNLSPMPTLNGAPLWSTLFATFPEPIESMETIKHAGRDEHLLVIAGGVGYVVDRHGTVTRL